MRRGNFVLLTTVVAVLLAACNEGASSGTAAAAPLSKPATERWYTRAQVTKGYRLFQTHCASCHQSDASGTREWRTADANGHYPPPPLNGTAHAWHHPLSVLQRTVREGGSPLGGTMPAFGDKLSSEEIDAVLAWVQSNWSEEVYAAWQSRNLQAQR